MDVIYHKQVKLLDYGLISVKAQNQFDAVLSNVLKQLRLIAADQVNLRYSVPCEYPPLIGWRKIRFHVGIDTPPDMRIIFKYVNDDVHVLAIGFRNYVYNMAQARDPRKF